MRRILALAVALWSAPASADPSGRCLSTEQAHAHLGGAEAIWSEMTPDQWQFARGMFVLDPHTSPGLPFGDRSVLITMAGRPGGLVIFMDGPQACDPMVIADEQLELFKAIAAGSIRHEGDGT